MLLTPKNLSILQVASKKETNPYYDFNSMLIDGEENCVYVSNGDSLYMSKVESSLQNEFPEKPLGREIETKILVPYSAIAMAEKNIPKKECFGSLKSIRVLANNETAFLTTFNQNVETVSKVKVSDGEYPDVKKTMDKMLEKKVCGSVNVSIVELEKLVKVMKKQKASYVKIETRGKSEPVVFTSDCKDTVAFVMPISCGDE